MKSHDKVLSNLERIVRDAEIVERNVIYGTRNRDIGEIDLLMYNNGMIWLFEVKSSYSNKLYVKALSQLKRAEKIYVPKYFPYMVHTVKKFIAVGNHATNYVPEVKWVK